MAEVNAVQKPSIGRIVHYRLATGDVWSINERRQNGVDDGNAVSIGAVVALIVTAVSEGDAVNGRAFLDGRDDLWIVGAQHGDGPGQWSWPPRV